jgi:hypothetical protein
MKYIVSLFALIAFTAICPNSNAEITVVGEGSVALLPDTATVSLAIVTEGKTPAAALDKNNIAMLSLNKALAVLDLSGSDVRTTDFNVSPTYNDNRLTGYSTENRISVRVTEISKLGIFLTAAVENSANRVTGLQLNNRNTNITIDTARAKAITDARHRANLYATMLGVKVGSVFEINENVTGAQPTYNVLLRDAVTSVYSGSPTITVRVRVVFAIDQGDL